MVEPDRPQTAINFGAPYLVNQGYSYTLKICNSYLFFQRDNGYANPC